jgi:subtilase family serine protease
MAMAGTLQAATGTSAATPLWAGVIALAEHQPGKQQGRGGG